MSSVKDEYEVDYDKNITKLYEAITNCDWDVAIEAVTERPREARTWVVRHYEESSDIMWRFLPLHSACARQPPASVISALLNAYPNASRCVDDQGMYPLHYACGNQASREVIRLLLVANPQAAKIADPRGMLPIHYLACWGPSSVSIIDMVLVANRDVGDTADADGNTALDLAKEGEYPERDAVIAALKRWFEKGKTDYEVAPSLTKSTSGDSTARDSDVAVSRLRQEVSVLKAEQKRRDEDWESKMSQSVSSLKSQCYDLERKVSSANNSLSEAREKVEAMESAMSRKDHEVAKKEERIAELTKKIYDLESERDDLRQTLTEVTTNCENFKRKADNMNDRIGSLSASLSSMMDQQAEVMKTLKDREAKFVENANIRRSKLQGLIEMEDRMVNASKFDTEKAFSLAFDRQAKEMEAIAAVINAIRK